MCVRERERARDEGGGGEEETDKPLTNHIQRFFAPFFFPPLLLATTEILCSSGSRYDEPFINIKYVADLKIHFGMPRSYILLIINLHRLSLVLH